MPYTETPLITLAIDTTTPGGSTAVLRDERVIGSFSTWTDETYSSRMFRQVAFLLEELGIGLDHVDLFAAASGPGSFTGLRVGLAAVKGWAEVYGKPVVGVSALEAIAEESRSGASVLVPTFDARRGEVYFGVYRREGVSEASGLAPVGEHSSATPGDFLKGLRERMGTEAFTIVTPTPEVLQPALEGNEALGEGIRVEVVPNILAPVVGLLAMRRSRSGLAGDALSLEANYVRRTDAELKFKA